MSADKLSSAQCDNAKHGPEYNMSLLLAKLRHMTKLRRFKLEPHTKTVKVKVKPHHMTTTQLEFKCHVHQLPVNLDGATTDHKLQSMTKCFIIITSWRFGELFKNWKYTLLLRIRSQKGLFLFKEVSLDKSFVSSDKLKAYGKRAKRQEKEFLEN